MMTSPRLSLHHIIDQARRVPASEYEQFVAPARQVALSNPDLAGQLERIERLRKLDAATS